MASSSSSGSVDIHHGRLRFVPGAGPSRRSRYLEAGVLVLAIALGAVAVVDGSAGVLIWIALGFLALAVILKVAAFATRSRDMTVPPREPVTVAPTLVATIRELQASGRDVEAIRLVREQVGVGLVDGKKIADAARVDPS